MKDLYDENCKSLMKEIEEDTKEGKDILCLWIGIIHIVKICIPFQGIFLKIFYLQI